MPWRHARITNRAHHDQFVAYGAFDSLAQRIVQVRLFEVAASGDVDDANVVFFSVLNYPLQTTVNIPLRDTASLANLHEHNFAIRRDAPIEAPGEIAVSCRHHRSHHSVPTGNVRCLER